MPTVIKTRIVKIGNSQGIRIPRVLLKQTNLNEDVELEVQSGQIIVRPIQNTRHNWENAFKAMAKLGDDELLDGNILTPTSWEEGEWEW